MKQHIESFPKVESHYCRVDTQRDYLDSTLSIKQMYRLYLQSCTTAHKNPVKESFYRNIFFTEYNFHFHVPKKDRCDVCEEVKLRKIENNLSTEKALQYYNHVKEKTATRNEKKMIEITKIVHFWYLTCRMFCSVLKQKLATSITKANLTFII